MSKKDNNISATENFEFENKLKAQAKDLMSMVESGNIADALRVISDLNETRDRSLYIEVGRLTRSLHEAIRNFHIDAGGNAQREEELSKMSDASDRLTYVVNLTNKAANKTLDLVEASMPIASELRDEAHLLKSEWVKLGRKELTPAEFRELYKRMDVFLVDMVGKSDKVCSNLSEILLAQDFQDLTGQVIQKVTMLVREVEENLVRLVSMAGKVDQMTGTRHELDAQVDDMARGHGPQMNAEVRADVVSSQDDVDDLLSSLGF